MSDSLAGSRVLVTGASGFVGAHVCRALRARGAYVIAAAHGGSIARADADAVLGIDLRDRHAVRAVVGEARPRGVIHLAAHKSVGRGVAAVRESYDVNVMGTMHLAEALADAGECERLVALGSAEEYGRAAVPFDVGTRELPLTPYGMSKLAATRLLESLNAAGELSATVLRATVVYGPGQAPGMLIPSLVRALVAGERFPMTDGSQTRDFVYVRDVVDGLLLALGERESAPHVLHLSAGAPVPVREVALTVAAAVGGDAASLLDFGASPLRVGEAREYWATNSATRACLGWTPRVSLADGIAETVAAHRATVTR